LKQWIEGADLLFHEATFLHQDLLRAKETGHSTAEQAATTAAECHVKRLCIGHFSARYEDETLLLQEAQRIFENTLLAKENLILNL
jgi:ribonuclease Z